MRSSRNSPRSSDAAPRCSTRAFRRAVGATSRGVGVASLIEHPDRGVALAALNAIVGGAVPRAHTDVVVRAPIVVLDGEDVVLRKEAIWALNLLGSEGTEMTSAIAERARCGDELIARRST